MSRIPRKVSHQLILLKDRTTHYRYTSKHLQDGLHLLQRQLLVCVLHASVLGYNLPTAPHNPLARQQALNTNGPPRMDAAGADTHLSTQPKPMTAVVKQHNRA